VADIGMAMKAGNEPSGSGRPGLPGLGLSGPGLAAAILLHAAVLASFLLQPVKPLPPAPGAAAIMVSLVQAGAVQKQKEAEQEEEKTGPPQPEPLQPEPEPEPVRPEPVPVPAPARPRPAAELIPMKDAPPLPPAAPSSASSASGARMPGMVADGPAAEGASSAGLGAQTAQADYLAQVQSWLAAHKRYPRAARRMGIEGAVQLRFTVARDGAVLAHRIEKSSGSEILDTEVERMLGRAAPLPPFPANIGSATLEFVIPVRFSLDQ
jgi:protein TonB